MPRASAGLCAGLALLAAAGCANANRTTSTPTVPTTVAPPVPTTRPGPPSASTSLTRARVIPGDITPKSVVASGEGHVFAQNMMYRHTITVYGLDGTLTETINDAVDLAEFGYAEHPGVVKGAPVEAAFSPDRRYAYISNYSMYGPGFSRPGDDVCRPGQYDESYVYRVNVSSFFIDKVIAVGSVPKYVAVTPDNRYVLVSNWCSYDLSVIDTKSGSSVARIKLGKYPRGIVVDPTSETAYVAIMGGHDIAKVRLADFSVSWIRGVGAGPRHLVLDPAGRFMYVTLNTDGQVIKVDLRTDRIVGRLRTGSAPRSMAVAPDGQSLYVVNYDSSTVSKVRAADMTLLQTLPTDANPIGVTYEPISRTVWVACYHGTIIVFNDT